MGESSVSTCCNTARFRRSSRESRHSFGSGLEYYSEQQYSVFAFLSKADGQGFSAVAMTNKKTTNGSTRHVNVQDWWY
jgi:hypothetical protein